MACCGGRGFDWALHAGRDSGIGLLATVRRDAAQERREAKKRRADKFEELVAAVYEFDHWIRRERLLAMNGEDISETAEPFAKLQSISAVYFPEFSNMIDALWEASGKYRVASHKAGRLPRQAAAFGAHLKPSEEHSGQPVETNPFEPVYYDQIVKAIKGMDKTSKSYAEIRDLLITALQDFARKEFR